MQWGRKGVACMLPLTSDGDGDPAVAGLVIIHTFLGYWMLEWIKVIHQSFGFCGGCLVSSS